MHGKCPRLVVFSALLLLVASHEAAGAITDQLKWPPGQVPVGQTNGPDSLDDIWQGMFNAWGIDPNGDDDKDGTKNILECIAGTNPFVASDCFKIGNMTVAPTAVIFSSKVEAGKKYRVISSDAPAGPTWTPETLQTPVSGVQEYVPSADLAEAFLSIQRPAGSKKFYKLETTDVDTNGDGVSDWVSRKLGLNPAMTDSDGDGVSDAAAITQELTTQDTVTLSADNAFTSEDGGQPGMLRLRRSRSLLGATIFYTLGGTAGAGDFAPLAGSVYFAPGAREAYIAITPNTDSGLEGGESVTVTLTGGTTSSSTPIQIGGANKASVIIANTTAPTGTGLLGRFYDNASSTFANAANFGDVGTYTYTRSGTSPNYTGSVVIPYTKTPALSVGNVVRVTFTGGNLNTSTYNSLDYTVTAVSPGVSFTFSLPGGSGLPATSASTCTFSIQSFPHPPVAQRVDPTVDFEYAYGTPNGVTVVPNNQTDNYSDTFETYLQPAAAGLYTFQLDADDKARVLLDVNRNGVFDLPAEQIVESGWDTANTVGTFIVSGSAYNLVVPATPDARYKMRVEHVETTGEARCRLQWSLNGGTFANISQAEQYSHTQAATYAFTRASNTTGTATITLTGHGLNNGDSATLAFSSGNLFTPNASDPAGYSKAYTVSGVTSTTFNVTITGTNLPANVSAGTACFLENRPASTTTGVFNKIYLTTDFSNAAARVGVDAAVTTGNNGIWGAGAPDPAINPDTFSARWTGQVQPQFTEDYTFVVYADDGCSLKINGQVQDLRPHVSTNQSGSTYSYNSTTGSTVVTYSASVLKASSFVVGETVRVDPTSGPHYYPTSGASYDYDSATGNMVVTYSALTNLVAGSIQVGETVFLDPTSGNLSALSSLPYVVTAASSTTFTVSIGAGLYISGTGTISLADTMDLTITAVAADSFTVAFPPGRNITGTGNMSIEIINKPINDWVSFGNERYVRIPMIGGARYDIQLDYWESSGYARCRLYWYSPSQTRQIIPKERLYPSSAALAPPSHVSSTDAVALIGGVVSIPVAANNGASISVSGAPAWLNYAGGVLSGTPPAGSAGNYQILLTLTDADGTSTSLINLRVDDTGANVVREQWDGVPGTSIASIPGSGTPSTSTLTSLQGPTNAGDDFGARIRGYITAPATGNYYFWIAASSAAELWISNDDDTVNLFKRAWITTGTTAQEWNNATETRQKSPWLALEQGKRYYFEILHKAGTGNDHLAVGWLKPGQSGSTPSEVVPGFVLSPYTPPAPGSTPGTLYVSSMLSQNAAVTNGVGTSTLRLSEDETTAIMRYSYSGLTGPITSQHIHVDAYLNNASMIVYDIDTPATEGDGIITSGPDAGAHKWTIKPVGTLTAADIREIIKQGKAYINLHTAMYPNGEIRGNYTLAHGSRVFTAPPAPPAWTDDHADATNTPAVRFLTQATFGPSPADIKALKAMTSYEAWIDDQFTKPLTLTLPEVLRTERADAQGGAWDESLTFNSWWRNSITGPDQLRQRVAFALSEILVVSAQGPLDNRGDALSYFYDRLVTNAFGNFRDLLEDVTLTPTMGRYLDMLRNDKPDMTVGRIPNENYAREIEQLFSIGLFRMWPDGTLVLSESDAPIETYTQREIIGFAHTFTGWDYGYDGAYRTSLSASSNWMRQMREVPARHFTGPKRVLNNEVLPGLPSIGGATLDPYATHSSAQYSHPSYQALPGQEMDATHDQLFQHPNVGPFICRQLIQRLVTSHPSRDYVYRVVQKFNDNGSGVRGDMKAVIKAILLDYEARSPAMLNKPAFGKQREPVMQVAASARAFAPTAWTGTYSQSGGTAITVTTATPHKLASGNTVFLDFTSGTSAPWIGTYSISNVTTNAFTVTAQGWATGTYSIPANSTDCTVTMSSHWLGAGQKFYMDFTSGSANGVTDLDGVVYTTTSVSAESGTNITFTFPITTGTSTSARTGNCMIPRHNPGSFTTTSSGLSIPQDRRVIMDTNTNHELAVGDKVQLNFTSGSNPQPVDMEVTVESVVDLNTWTFLADSTGTNLGTSQGNNSVYQFPLKTLPLTRSGNVSSRPSTFALNSTDADFNQSPLNSPTVFNFFLPDFKFPGALASQGLTTPEFQLTAETNVVRQANFMYNGMFNPTGTVNISSFRGGTNALVMDYSDWMGNAVATAGTVGEVLGAGAQTGQVWTSNANLPTLIDRLNTLLAAGQLSASAKTAIQSLVSQWGITAMTATNPCKITTSAAHDFETGDVVTIAGVTGGTFSPSNVNTTFTITKVDATSFTIPVNCTSISNLVLTNATVGILPYTNSSPTTTQIRDRLRTIIHLIITSPDFAIQR